MTWKNSQWVELKSGGFRLWTFSVLHKWLGKDENKVDRRVSSHCMDYFHRCEMLKILPSSLLWHDIVGRERCCVLSLTQQLRSENENEKLEKCFFHVAALSSKLSEKSVAWKQRVCTEKLKWKLFEWEFYSFVLFLPPPPSAPSSSSSSMMKLKRSLHESSEVRRVTSQTMWTKIFSMFLTCWVFEFSCVENFNFPTRVAGTWNGWEGLEWDQRELKKRLLWVLESEHVVGICCDTMIIPFLEELK